MFVSTKYSNIKNIVESIATEAIMISEMIGDGLSGWTTCLETSMTLTNRAFGDAEGTEDYLYDLALGSAILATKLNPQWYKNFSPTELDVFEQTSDFTAMVGHIALRIQDSLISVNMLNHRGNTVAATEEAAKLVSDAIVIVVNCAALNGKLFTTSHLDDLTAIMQ